MADDWRDKFIQNKDVLIIQTVFSIGRFIPHNDMSLEGYFSYLFFSLSTKYFGFSLKAMPVSFTVVNRRFFLR